MAKTFTEQKFSAGEQVAYYSNEVLHIGEVIEADHEKAVIAIEHNIYPKNGERITGVTLFDFVRRSDGLFVSVSSVDERVPSQMIARLDEIGAMNEWRYWPSPIEKLKRKFAK
jgi:hypothetical protein